MTITDELVTLFVLVFGALVGVWARVEARINAAKVEAVSVAAEARTKVDELAKDLTAHRLHSEATFATKLGLTEALNRVHDALDKLTDRIDVLISQSGTSSKRPSA